MADKALLLGINNYKNVGDLRGCVHDVASMRGLLTGVFGFEDRNVKQLLDARVVKAEVRKGLRWLFRDARDGDRAVLHFSGHGSYVPDRSGDEPDGRDELLCLHDMDFDDPDTFLLDDELRAWAETRPEGVRLLVVLDNCNSGTGTRLMLAEGPNGSTRAVRVDDRATLRRGMAAASARAIDDPEAIDPEGADAVRVRFVDPPPRVKAEVLRLRSARPAAARGYVEAPLDYDLLTGCRADQTSADATIDGQATGAFTHYLCETLRAGQAAMERSAIIERVEAALKKAQFSQVPQFEGRTARGPLFSPVGADGEPAEESADDDDDAGRAGGDEPVEPVDAPPPGGAGDGPGLFDLLDKIRGLDPEVQKKALDLFAAAGGGGRAASRASARRVLVYVHGICKHLPDYSRPWWLSLKPFTAAFGPGNLTETRREVLWSDLVNARALAAVTTRGDLGQRERLEEEIRETLRDRAERHALDAAPALGPGDAPRALAADRALISIPGLNCLDDFTAYMVDDSVRASVIARFTRQVRPLLESGVEVDVISHSWGTVVAYEGLRELAENGFATPLVRNYFTVGSALSIGAVKASLRSRNKDGRKPANVRRWVNVDARGDVVGGPLRGRPYAVDHDFPDVHPFGCASLFGVVTPTCAHASYFVRGNLAVNRDIFAAFINAV